MTCFQSTPNGSDYGRVEVPMHIVPSPKISSACLQSLTGLPSILSMEEEEAYQRLVQLIYSIASDKALVFNQKVPVFFLS